MSAAVKHDDVTLGLEEAMQTLRLQRRADVNAGKAGEKIASGAYVLIDIFFKGTPASTSYTLPGDLIQCMLPDITKDVHLPNFDQTLWSTGAKGLSSGEYQYYPMEEGYSGYQESYGSEKGKESHLQVNDAEQASLENMFRDVNEELRGLMSPDLFESVEEVFRIGFAINCKRSGQERAFTKEYLDKSFERIMKFDPSL